MVFLGSSLITELLTRSYSECLFRFMFRVMMAFQFNNLYLEYTQRGSAKVCHFLSFSIMFSELGRI